MIALLALVFFLQGIPLRPNEGGTITGVLKDANGKPAVRVRVGAIPQPDGPVDLASASAMISIAETDAAGRYRLEDVPAGRYYIAAGRVDFPTYFPGTQALARGTVVSITSRAVVEGIDFVLQDSSIRVPGLDLLFGLPASLTFSIPLQASVEGGGKLPVFSPGGFMFIRLTNLATGIRTEVPINESSCVVSGPTAEYRVSIENLPPGYRIKSMMAGTTDLTTSNLQLSSLSFKTLASAGLINSLSLGSAPMTATTTVSVVLARAGSETTAATSVRIAGRAGNGERRSIYLDGKPGTFYSDGTFEFRGVQAGRHTLATIENPGAGRPLGGSLIVGNRDVDGINLDEVSLLPMDIRSPAPTTGTQPAGTLIRLPSLRVVVVDEASRQPTGPGTVYVIGPFGTSFDLPAEGRFEFPRLLPGKYSFEIQVFRHITITRTVVMGDEDVDLELSVTSLE